MDKIAIISGVYGNAEALKSVLNDIDNRGIKEVYCIGNSIREGADNLECLRLLKERCSVILVGDKEEKVSLLGEGDSYSTKELNIISKMKFSHQFYMSGKLVRLFNSNPYNTLIKNAYSNRKKELFKPSIRTGKSYADVIVFSDYDGTLEENIGSKTLIGVQNVCSSFEPPKYVKGNCANYMILEGKKDSKEIAPISFQHVKVYYEVELAKAKEQGPVKKIGTK